jgi:hypothetical protein
MTTQSDPEGHFPTEQSAAAGPGSLEAELLDAQAKAQEHWNSYLRAVAETDNVRKRAQRDVEAAGRYAIERFAGDLLEARDSLELGLAVGPGADPARLFEGMEATLRLVDRAFEKAGLQVLDPAGEPSTPNCTRRWRPSPAPTSRLARCWRWSRRATCSTGACCARPGYSCPASPTRPRADLNPGPPAPN